MMLALLIYCYANRLFSSRKIEQATHRDVAVRFLTGNTHPDHDTVCKFRRENFDAFNNAFVSVLELAQELKLLKLGDVAIDGTHIKANASIDQNVTYERALEIRDQLQLDVAELLEQAETADKNDEDHQKLPKEIERREELISKMDQAVEELKQRATVRDAKAQAYYEEKLKERQRKEEETRGKNAQATQNRPGEQRRASQPNRSRRRYHAQEQARRIHRKLQRASRRRC